MEFVRENYGWCETEMENTYKGYKSAECIMAGVHDFTCYMKRGFGRGTIHATEDVKRGILTREEGFELAKRCDTERPEALDYYLKITGMTEEEFYNTMKKVRHGRMKGIELPVTPKKRPNKEVIKPFAEQIIERRRGIKDIRNSK